MSATVSIPTILRTHTGGEKQVKADGSTLQEVIADLEANHPGIKDRLVTDGALHRFDAIARHHTRRSQRGRSRQGNGRPTRCTDAHGAQFRHRIQSYQRGVARCAVTVRYQVRYEIGIFDC